MAASRFDPDLTQDVIDAIGPGTSPRTRQVISSLIRHLHDFAREVDLTVDEWMLGVQFLNSVGQGSHANRNEGRRISNIIGMEALVDEIAGKAMAGNACKPTSSTIAGPFWSAKAPFRPLGGSIIQNPHNSEVVLMHGKVTDLITKQGLPGSIVDVWQASSNGKYDLQDPENQTENNLRGKFSTDENGEYWFDCLRPTTYTVPTDGPAGILLALLDRHPMRPAHIHLMITHPTSKPLTTQIFPSDDPNLSTDTIFAVKKDLVVDFKPLDPALYDTYRRKNAQAQKIRSRDSNTTTTHVKRADEFELQQQGKEDTELRPRNGTPTLELEFNIVLAPRDGESASP